MSTRLFSLRRAGVGFGALVLALGLSAAAGLSSAGASAEPASLATPATPTLIAEFARPTHLAAVAQLRERIAAREQAAQRARLAAHNAAVAKAKAAAAAKAKARAASAAAAKAAAEAAAASAAAGAANQVRTDAVPANASNDRRPSMTTAAKAAQAAAAKLAASKAPPAPVKTTPVKTAPAPTGADEPGIANSVLSMLNSERSAHGLPALTMSSQLISSAHKHNLAMDAANTMSHQLPGEAYFADRISATGYQWTSCGENIGWNSDMSTAGALALEQEMYAEGPSGGHYQNIENRAYKNVGIDIWFDYVHNKLWLTEDFGG